MGGGAGRTGRPGGGGSASRARQAVFGNRQDGGGGRQGAVNGGGDGPGARFPHLVRESAFLLHRELTMADAAFVVTTVAVFALVAFIAKGVAKL